MKKFWQEFLDEHEDLLFRATPRFLMEIMRKYFRLQVEGLENIPKTGPALIIPNHSGVSGFDAMILAYEIFKATGRAPKVLTHHFWFLTKTTAIPASRLGFVEASTANGLRELKKGKIVILFPEGELGNFKPTKLAYELQEFKRGFVRMAIRTGAPIIPTMVIGAEETHVNLSQLKFSALLRGLVIPLPLNIIPLPSKWKIKFLKPTYLPYKPEKIKDRELVREIAEDIRDQLQNAIVKEVEKRESVFV